MEEILNPPAGLHNPMDSRQAQRSRQTFTYFTEASSELGHKQVNTFWTHFRSQTATGARDEEPPKRAPAGPQAFNIQIESLPTEDAPDGTRQNQRSQRQRFAQERHRKIPTEQEKSKNRRSHRSFRVIWCGPLGSVCVRREHDGYSSGAAHKSKAN